MQAWINSIFKSNSHRAIELGHNVGLDKVGKSVAEPAQQHGDVASFQLDVEIIWREFSVRDGDLMVIHSVDLHHLWAASKDHGQVFDIHDSSPDVLDEPRVSSNVVVKFKVEANILKLRWDLRLGSLDIKHGASSVKGHVWNLKVAGCLVNH